MTEAEWLVCRDPVPMLERIRGQASERKLRLFACGVGRAVWGLLLDYRSRFAIEQAEQFADGNLEEIEREAARNRAAAVVREMNDRLLLLGGTTSGVMADRYFQAAFHAVFTIGSDIGDVDQHLSVASSAWFLPEIQPDLLREIFGNPFRSATAPWTWRTAPAVSLARQMRDVGEFSAMPILADALQDAGCDSADILDHCRGPGPHVRGCWVVDLVLGKE